MPDLPVLALERDREWIKAHGAELHKESYRASRREFETIPYVLIQISYHQCHEHVL